MSLRTAIAGSRWARSLIAFHLGLVFTGLVPNLVSRPLHMALVAALGAGLAAARGAKLAGGAGAARAGIAACLWVAFKPRGARATSTASSKVTSSHCRRRRAAADGAGGRAPRDRLAAAAGGGAGARSTACSASMSRRVRPLGHCRWAASWAP
ncbi:MAG: hypothetical protein U5K43_14020 [Halofilum sp. (in: g-proteobacteria)]|nr:hypothetical protein [Halofilum sp. (in: g-proteobacteria)]